MPDDTDTVSARQPLLYAPFYCVNVWAGFLSETKGICKEKALTKKSKEMKVL